MNYKSLLVMMFSIFAFSCVDKSPTLLDPGEEKVVDDKEGRHLTPGINWREEIEIYQFEPEVATKWNYETRGMIVIPSSVKEIEGMKVGDVLLAWGTFIFFVDKLESTDAGTEVSVRRFSVADAIHGEFDIPFFATQEAAASIGNIDWPTFTTELLNFGDGFATVKLNGSVLDAGLEFPVTIVGQFKGEIPAVPTTYNCEGETRGGYCIDYLLAKLTLSMKAYVNATFNIAGALEVGGEKILDIAAVRTFNRGIGVIPLGASGLGILPQLEIPGALQLTASAEAVVDFQAQVTAELPLGFEYRNRGYQGSTGGFDWLPNANHPESFTHSFTVETSKSGKVEMHQHIGVGVGFKIVPVASRRVGISGVGFAGKINEDITYDPFKPNNCLQTHFYFNITAKAQIKFFIDPWGPGAWEWELMSRTGSNGRPEAVVDGTIPIWKKTIIKSESGTAFCLDEGDVKQLRLTVVDADDPPGRDHGPGYELDGVQISRITNGMSSTWSATGASGGGNSSAATGEPDATTCSSYLSKVAAVTSSITLTFDRSFRDGDVIDIYQYVTGGEIGVSGACYGSGTIRVEVGNGSAWNALSGTYNGGNARITLQGSDLSF